MSKSGFPVLHIASKLLSNKKGVVLLLTFIVMTTILSISIVFLYLTSIQTRATGYTTSGHKAFWLAEAGLQAAIHRLKNDEDYRDDPFSISADLGEGSYLVTVTKEDSTYTLSSTGTVRNINRKVEQSVSITGTPEAYNYAIYTSSTIQDTHSSNFTIIGDIQEKASNFPIVDMIYYKSIASPGQDIPGNHEFTPGTYSGIWYIGGSVAIGSNVTINGSVIAEKQISCSREGNIVINASSPYPALITNDHIDFSRSNNITINGLIFAGNDGNGNMSFDRVSDCELRGTLIGNGNTSFKQSTDVIVSYNDAILSEPPPGISGGGGGEAGIVSHDDWQEIIPAM